MKTTNANQPGERSHGIVRGHVGRGRAGSPGITFRDGETEATEVNDLLITGATVFDNEDGTAILAIAGSGSEVWAQADCGLVGDGATDDTDALQACIYTATANGAESGTIRFEPGTYLIGGALQDTGDFNAQILLPANASSSSLTLTLQGPARATQGIGSDQGGMAILKSTLTGASGTAAVFSSGNTDPSLYQIVLKDLFCLGPTDPTTTFWNLLYARDGHIEGVGIRASGGGATVPTNSNSYGIKLPETSTSARVFAEVWVEGYYTGIRHAELTWGNYVAWTCLRAVEIVFAYHIGGEIKLQTLSCRRGIVVTGANRMDIIYDAEHWSAEGFAVAPGSYPAWSANVYDFDDGSNLFSGHVRWWGVKAAVDVDHVFLVNGGTNVAYEEADSLPDAGSINGVAITGTPAIGSVPIATSPTTAVWSGSATRGALLIASDHSSPIVFADILQASDGDDFLYASE